MSPAEEARVIQLWSAGLETAAIAQQLDTPVGTVSSQASTLVRQGNIEARPKGGHYPGAKPRGGRRGPPRAGTTRDPRGTRTPHDPCASHGRAQGHPAVDGAAVEDPDRAPQGRGLCAADAPESTRGGARVDSPDGSSLIDAFTGLDTRQDIIVDTIQASRAQAKESPPWRSNTWCCKRRRRLVRSPA